MSGKRFLRHLFCCGLHVFLTRQVGLKNNLNPVKYCRCTVHMYTLLQIKFTSAADPGFTRGVQPTIWPIYPKTAWKWNFSPGDREFSQTKKGANLQGGHGTGKTGNLVLTFSRQGKHREFCCNTRKIFETRKIFLTVFFTAKSMFPFTYFQFF